MDIDLLIPFCFSTEHARIPIDRIDEVFHGHIQKKIPLRAGDVLIIPSPGYADNFLGSCPGYGLVPMDAAMARQCLTELPPQIVTECLAALSP